VKKDDAYVVEGASLRNATEDEADKYDTNGGVIIEDVSKGKWKDAGIKDGFMITSINNRPVKNVNDLRALLRNSTGEGVLIKGKYPDGKEVFYGMGW
jgi:S1-C subfamily serine protease